MTHSGRCYCGRVSITVRAFSTVAYCHCGDCKRWTGSALPAFLACALNDLDVTPALRSGTSFTNGVERWNCSDCGSPLAARFDYLPGQTYIPLGLFEDLTSLAPALHCHAEQQAAWLHLNDDLPRETGSARETLAKAGHD